MPNIPEYQKLNEQVIHLQEENGKLRHILRLFELENKKLMDQNEALTKLKYMGNKQDIHNELNVLPPEIYDNTLGGRTFDSPYEYILRNET